MAKNHHFNLKSANSLRSNNADFLTVKALIFLTPFPEGGIITAPHDAIKIMLKNALNQ
jgi:hypothetical protein